MIKPIPTTYAGIEFRSRLEARWAMYFDLLGVEWIYEMEGFDLGNGFYYLPDFYLPKFDVYCEVKPFQQDDHKWKKFTENGKYRLILLFGKVHTLACPILRGSVKVIIPHEDSAFCEYGKLFYGDNGNIVDENQKFCDEANSYKF